MESLETLTLFDFGHGLKYNPEFLCRAQDIVWIGFCFSCLLFCVEKEANSGKTDLARGVTNGREAIGSDSIKVTFNTRAALRGELIPSWFVFPAALGEKVEPQPTVEPLAAEPPMTGAEPLSLLRQVHFEGLLPVVDSDMIVEGGIN
jgi:hypothetical protein